MAGRQKSPNEIAANIKRFTVSAPNLKILLIEIFLITDVTNWQIGEEESWPYHSE